MIRRIATIALVATLAVPAFSQGLLLIPNWDGDRVGAYDPTTGALIDANFIVDTINLDSPRQAIDSTRGTILVFDQIADGIFEYSYDGTFLRKIAGVAEGFDNVRGGAVRDGRIFVSIGSGTFANTVRGINLDGTSPATFTTNGANSSPFDVDFRASDVLVGHFTTTAGVSRVARFDLAGAPLSAFVPAVAWGGTQQVFLDPSGDVWIGCFSGVSTVRGIYRFDSAGTQLGFWNFTAGHRGVYRLANGNVLNTYGGITGGLFSLDTSTNVNTQIVPGSSHQYIEYVPVPDPTTVTGAVSLQAVTNQQGRDLTFLLVKSNGDVVQRGPIVTQEDGTFLFQTRLRGNYRILVKANKWLRADMGTFNITNAPLGGLAASLLTGDVNGDNVADGLDLAGMDASFNLAQGDTGFNPLADLNEDLVVDGLDLAWLDQNFNQEGANP